MIFSNDRWNKGREFQRVIRSSSAVEFESFEVVLRESFDLFIRPLLGEEMTNRLVLEYQENSGLDTVVLMAQRANANLALWYNFNELTVTVSGGGIQRVEAGDNKGLYKYQERELKEGYKTKGFNALDDLLLYLEQNVDDYAEFKNSPAYNYRRSALIPGAETVQMYLSIERSRLLFLRMQPHIRFIENTRLASLIGEGLLSDMRDKMTSGELEPIYSGLINSIQPVIILLAAARLVRQAGNLTDKGLYFTSVQATSGGDEMVSPAESGERETCARQLEQDAKDYQALADRYIKDKFPDFYQGKNSEVMFVDNDNLKIFWGL